MSKMSALSLASDWLTPTPGLLPKIQPSWLKWTASTLDWCYLSLECDRFALFTVQAPARPVLPTSDLLGRMDTIYKGLVREYDVLWGLLVLIPDVKEDYPAPPPPHTHTSQPASWHLTSPSVKTNTTPTHSSVTQHVHTYTHLWTCCIALRLKSMDASSSSHAHVHRHRWQSWLAA